MSNAILILLGNSRVGKDTAFNALIGNNINIKFSSPIKAAIAAYLGVPPELLNDDSFRNQVIEALGCTPLDLLVKSFDIMPELHPELGLYYTGRECCQAIMAGRNPVFTDMRNLVELDFVIKLSQAYSLPIYAVYVHKPNTKEFSSDRYVFYLWAKLHHAPEVCFYGSLANNATLPEYIDKVRSLLRDTPFMQ